MTKRTKMPHRERKEWLSKLALLATLGPQGQGHQSVLVRRTSPRLRDSDNDGWSDTEAFAPDDGFDNAEPFSNVGDDYAEHADKKTGPPSR